MPAHETPDAILTSLEADRLRARALELVTELDTIADGFGETDRDIAGILRWAGSASVILRELARG